MQANKLKTTQKFLILALLITLSSCVEKYWPELITTDEQFLVVDGEINNFSGPYTVKLSYSSSILDTTINPISSATVKILDDQGNMEELTKYAPGVYKTKTDGILGIIGRSYKIHITLDNGKIYESEFEKLLNPIEIESVFAKEELQYAQNALEEDQEGLRFYIQTSGNNHSNAYFFWEIEETYEYHSAEKITYYYDGTIANEGAENNFGLKEMKNQYALYYCWKTQTLLENFNYSLEFSESQKPFQFPLHFIPYGDERIRYGYNILVKQYNVSKEAYTFLSELENQNENQGSLFTTQPFQIKGNVFNTQDESELVLGYFKVASGSFGPRLQVRAPWRRYENPICNADSSLSYISNRITNSTAKDWPMYFTDYPYVNPENLNEYFYFFSWVEQSCLDCTKHGGSTTEPDFWQEWNKSSEPVSKEHRHKSN